MIIFKVIVFFVLGLLILAGLAFLLFVWWFRRKLKQAGGAAQSAINLRIKLIKHTGEWSNLPEVDKLAREFEALGFVQIGDYSVREMAGMHLRELIKADESVGATIFDHVQAGVWFDVGTKYPDESTAYCTTTKTAEAVIIPEDIAVRDRNFTPQAAYRKLLEVRKPGPYVMFNGDNFVTEFEASYARYMDKLAAQGGVSEEFTRAAPEALGDKTKYTDEQVAIARKIQQAGLAQKLNDVCIENFLKSSKLAAAEWEEIRDSVIVMHAQMNAEQVVDKLLDWADASGTIYNAKIDALKAQNHEAIALYQAIVQQKLVEIEVKKIGEVESPVKAHILRVTSV